MRRGTTIGEREVRWEKGDVDDTEKSNPEACSQENTRCLGSIRMQGALTQTFAMRPE